MKKIFSSYWLRSAFYTVLQRFSLTFFGLINFMIIVRWLTKPQMGTWALFLTVTTIFEGTKSALLKYAHIKYVTTSNDKMERTIIASSSLIINTSITLIFILLLYLFSGWISFALHTGNDLALMLKYYIPGLICMVFFSHLEAIQQSHLDFKGVFAGYLVRQFLFFVLIFFHTLFDVSFDLVQLVNYQVISLFVGTIVLYIYSRQYLMHIFKPTKQWVKKIVSYGGYIFGSIVSSNIYSNVDQIMTASFISSASVAYYNVASRVNVLVDIPSYAAAEILFPKSSHALAEDNGREKVKYFYERMVGILLSFTVPIAIFIILFPKFVIMLFAGSQYEMAAPILQLYMITGLIRPMQNQAANILNSIGKPALCFFLNTGGLCVNLCINYFLLTYIGFYGAAIGTLISIFIGFIFWYFVMRKQINMQFPNIFRYMRNVYKDVYEYSADFLYKRRKVTA